MSLALLLRWDRHGRLRPVPLGSEEADALLAGMPEEERMASWHLVEPAGRDGAGTVHSAGAAFSPVFAPASPAGARSRGSPPASRAPPSAPTAWWPTIARCSGAPLPARGASLG